MADDLDGVRVTSSVPVYQPGEQYRVKEMDPDESGGGKDFYDGFMRRKKKEGEEESVADEPGVDPIPVTEPTDIHDDIILSERAQKILEHPLQSETDEAPAERAEQGLAAQKKPDVPPQISFQA